MNLQDTNKSSAELQKEVHGQIDKIGSNIEDVKKRMTPGSLIDDAVFYPHGKNLSATYSHLKANPMGTMFLSLGTLLLMEDQHKVTYEAHLKSSMGDAAEKSAKKYQDTKRSLGQKAHELSDEIRSKKDSLASKASSKKEEISKKFQEKKSSLTEDQRSNREDFIAGARDLEREEKLRSYSYALSSDGSSEKSVKEKSAQKFDDIRDNISEKFQSAKSSVENKLDNASPIGQAMHPFAIASIGLGLGATLGASIPSDKVESLIQDPESKQKLQRLNKDFDKAIRDSGERLKSRLIDELKSVSFH